MKPLRTLILLATLALGLLAQAQSIYQVSTLSALLTGVYGGTTTVGELLWNGNFGIGTFDALDGEMVILDGVCYQITSTGAVNVMDKSATTPFAAVTSYQPELSIVVLQPTSFADIEAMADKLCGENYFYAIRVSGKFTGVKARSVPRQTPPYLPLAEVVKKQTVFTVPDGPGTLVGFRCPKFVAGINVPGYHLHYLSDDHKSGGHMLDGVLEQGVINIETIRSFQMNLPNTTEFQRANLTGDKTAETAAVEKGK